MNSINADYLRQMLVQVELILAPTRNPALNKVAEPLTTEQVEALDQLAELLAKSINEADPVEELLKAKNISQIVIDAHARRGKDE